MVRVITQILIGLMLVFGVITLGYRVLFYIAKGNILRALYFLLPCSIALFFAVLAFITHIQGLWKYGNKKKMEEARGLICLTGAVLSDNIS